ncbi:voltage-dependent calcium channel subunit alpha-2/delta-3 [Elysia marginata]|uniref:Voltage-dependent calcium channel subunit alpha-2/delta-3 n=1 Tax=Elysia marginata TaxID=1093978 RepID=A0AAV4GPR0_9GAST|nr:voltage-dependent calcium channel subunit alpha-2/delta-3 [Elysia marginata]
MQGFCRLLIIPNSKTACGWLPILQKYIQVLSRPLAIKKAKHKVWSPVYLDYVTEQGNILVNAGKPPDLGPDYEDSYTYQGLGLILTISMPVYDLRDKVLGVNGYAFAITNHGNIVFHPDYRPFYTEGAFRAKQQLKVRPKYNSVELSEVELPVPSEDGQTMAHPLRHYLVRLKSGGHNMTTVSVLTHCDGMKRATERQQEYQFQDIEDAFSSRSTPKRTLSETSFVRRSGSLRGLFAKYLCLARQWVPAWGAGSIPALFTFCLILTGSMA